VNARLGGFAVRGVTIWTLIVLIVSCPLFCAADECDSRAHHARGASGPGCDPSAPSSCPNDAGNCICDGAVLRAIARPLDLDTAVLPLPCDSPSASSFGCGPSIHSALLRHRGWLIHPAAWDDAASVCAWLQDFRC
jgi:hypothetical protein